MWRRGVARPHCNHCSSSAPGAGAFIRHLHTSVHSLPVQPAVALVAQGLVGGRAPSCCYPHSLPATILRETIAPPAPAFLWTLKNKEQLTLISEACGAYIPCSDEMAIYASLVLLCAAKVKGQLSFPAVHQEQSITWNYQRLNETGKSCPEKDSCNFARSSRHSLEQDWKSRNCFCDIDCSVYGDCCIDAKAYNPTEQRDVYGSFSCVTLKQYGDVYMKSRCPAPWRLPNIRDACESDTRRKDPLGSLPMTDRNTGITYRNYYCAICNGMGVSELQFWKPRLECPTLNGYNNRFKNITKQFLLNNLKQNSNGQWGVEVDTIGISVFHDCFIEPVVPEFLEPRLRQCKKGDIIHSCPQEFLDDKISSLCSSYTAIMYTSENIYRNIHCAMCHGVNLGTLVCVDISTFLRSGFSNGFRPTSFAVLFDVNGEGSVGQSDPCEEGELWDPFLTKCRNVVCGVQGQIYRQGKCYDKTRYIETTRSSTTTPSTTTATTTSPPTTTSPTTSTPIPTTTLTTSSLYSTPLITAPITEAVTSTVVILGTTESVIPTTSESESSTETWTKKPSLSSPINTETLPQPSKDKPKMSSTTPEPIIEAENVPLHDQSNNTFKTCPKIYLKPEEFKYRGKNIYIPAYNRTVVMGSYEFVDANLVTICVPPVLQKPQCPVAKFSPVMGYVTVACLGLSVFCLLLHLTATCIAPELQNLSGKNLFSFSAALLGGYSSFLVNILAVDTQNKLACFILAVLMYYFFISSFVWMLVIAFDVARTLKLATTQLRLSTGGQWRVFLLYSGVGWGVPSLATIVASVIDLISLQEIPSNFRPGFGMNRVIETDKPDSEIICQVNLCWFSSRDALLVYFVLPFACIMLLNIIFFIYSACLVWEASKNSAKITTTGPKTNFLLYLRLAILMGLTWLAGLVAAALDKEPVWYVFLGLNTLQGLFILLFFTCSKKIVRSIGEKLFGAGPPEDNTWRSKISSTTKRDESESSSSNRMASGGRTRQGYAQYHQYDQRYYQ